MQYLKRKIETLTCNFYHLEDSTVIFILFLFFKSYYFIELTFKRNALFILAVPCSLWDLSSLTRY